MEQSLPNQAYAGHEGLRHPRVNEQGRALEEKQTAGSDVNRTSSPVTGRGRLQWFQLFNLLNANEDIFLI